MTLQDIRNALQTKALKGGLTFGALTSQIPALSAVLEQLPANSTIPLTKASFEIGGSGDAQVLTIGAVAAWGLMPELPAVFTVAVDASRSGGFIASARFELPPTTKLDVPGLPWFALDAFWLGGASLPYSLYSGGLMPAANVQLGATLVLGGDTSKTPIPITIADDSSGMLRLSIDTAAVDLPSINDILAAFGSDAGAVSLPPTLNALTHFSLLDLFVSFDPASGKVAQIGLQIGNSAKVSGGWEIIDGYLSLDSYAIGLNVVDPMGTRKVNGLISAKVTLGTVDVAVAALHPPGGGWDFQGVIGADQPVPIGELVAGLASTFHVTLPDALRQFTLGDFLFHFNTETADVDGQFTLTFTVGGKAVELTVVASFTHSDDAYTVAVQGSLVIGSATFDVAFSKEAGATTFTASWKDAANPLEFGDIAAAFGWDSMPAVPEGLDLALTGAEFTFDFTGAALAFSAHSLHYGLLFFASQPSGPQAPDQRFYVIALDVPLDVKLSEAPVIGDKIPAGEDVGLSDLQLILSSGLTIEQVQKVNAVLALVPSSTPLPSGALGKAAMAISLSLGAQAPLPLMLGVNSDAPAAASAPAPDSPPATPASAPPPAKSAAASTNAPATAWLNVQKSLGPVNFKRIGLSYHDGKIWLLLDAGFTLAALNIDLLGLGLGSSLQLPPSLAPTISGMAVGYSGGEVTISGGLTAFVNAQGEEEYDGTLTLSADPYELSAMASYTTIQGEASLFAFALLDAPLGGPAFFFVTGVAAALGVNRDLLVPSADKLADFPMIKAVMGSSPFAGKTDPAGAINVMAQYIPAKYGEYWLGLGIRFTTFELLKSFAMAILKFGTELEVDLIGASALSIPSDVASPIAFAELLIDASYKPSIGVLALEARLAPTSFILSKDCHLSGGYAFYAWTKDNANGARAGDFVVTLGGYHPAFKPPGYYPVEPRLSVNWQVSSCLTVKGDFYFALTPNAAMAGGAIDATWGSGGINAWFSAHADFLLAWKPFHYEASAGVSIGASYTVDLLLTSFTVTVHVGVDLEFWGPSFAGTAAVDLYVCTITISFGDSAPDKKPIAWPDFKTSFLPAATGTQTGKSLGAAAAEPSTASFCFARAASGLIKDLSAQPDNASGYDWVVSPETVALVTATAIPAKSATLDLGGAAAKPLPSGSQSFGVGPVNVPDASLASAHAITIRRIEPAQTKDETLLFDAAPVVKSAPAAIWSAATAMKADVTSLNAPVRTLDGLVTGYRLTPIVPKPDRTLSIDLALLQMTQAPTQRKFPWSTPQFPAATADQTDPWKKVMDSLAGAGGVQASRAALLQALAAQGLATATTVDLSASATSADQVMLSPPVLSALGAPTSLSGAGHG